MKRLSRTLLFFTLAALVLTSCTIQKRVYRKGFHVVWNTVHSREANLPESLKNEKPSLVNKTIDEEVVVSANRLSNVDLAKKPALILNKDTCGDILLLHNADKLAVKILEIEEKTIKYKRCDNMDGPVYSIRKNKVAMITYANGVKEKVIAEPEPLTKTNYALRIELPTEPKLNKLGLWSLLSLLIILALLLIMIVALFFYSLNFALAGVVILLVAGVILPLTLAYFSLGQFRKEPDKYYGKWIPIVTISFFLLNLVRIVFDGVIVGSVLELIGAIVGLLVLLGLMIYLLLPKKSKGSSAK